MLYFLAKQIDDLAYAFLGRNIEKSAIENIVIINKLLSCFVIFLDINFIVVLLSFNKVLYNLVIFFEEIVFLFLRHLCLSR